MSPRASARAAALVALLLVTAGCAQPVPAPETPAAPAEPPPALQSEQYERILADLGEKMAAADGATSVDPAETRLTDPALRMRAAEYTLQTADAEREPVALGFEALGEIVPQTYEWPRWFVAVAKAPEDNQSERVYMLRQETARDSYALWGWVRLFPGVTFPQTTSPQVGSPPLAEDDATLRTSPVQTLDHYVDVLNKGSKSDYAADFADDPLRDSFTADAKTLRDSVKEIGGTVAWTHQAGTDGVYAMRTADGGAIVFGTIRSTLDISVSRGSFEVYDLKALTGKKEFKKSASGVYDEVVLFSVPPQGSTDPIQPLGGERILVQADGS